MKDETFDLTPAFLAYYTKTPVSFFVDSYGIYWVPLRCLAKVFAQTPRKKTDLNSDGQFSDTFWTNWHSKYFMNEYAIFMTASERMMNPDAFLEWLFNTIAQKRGNAFITPNVEIYQREVFAAAAGFTTEAIFNHGRG